MHLKNAFLFIFLIASASLVCLIIINEEDKRQKHVSSSSSSNLNSLPSTKLWVNDNIFSNNELFIYENESSSM